MQKRHPKRNACGLDFGTSNSSIGYCADGQATLTPIDGKTYIPSAIFFDYDKEEPLFGNEAIERYVDGAEGRMIWSPKNALGTGLIAEKTLIRGKRVSFMEIIALIVRNLKKRCEIQAQCEVDSVVCGRPVYFNDDDKALDKLAEDSMREILKTVGFKDIRFEYEPIAAAIHYERLIDKEQIALIVDMGGGTSDFTVVKLSPKREHEKLKNILSVGGIHVAGTDFDRQLSLKTIMPELGMGTKYKSLEGPMLPVPPSIYLDLATWHKIGFVYSKHNLEFVQSKIYSADSPEKFERLLHVLRYRYGHFLARIVEKSKIALSDKDSARIEGYEVKPPISIPVTRELFEAAIKEQVQKIADTVKSTIAQAGVAPPAIGAVFMTGGSSLIPVVRKAIMSLLVNAQIVEGDKFGSVAMGLTLAASTPE